MTDKELFEELSLKRKNVYSEISESEKNEMLKLCDGYIDFLSDCKTERECVHEIVRVAKENGFVNLDDVSKLQPGDKIYSVNRGKNVFMAVIGSEDISSGLNIVGAHIDSPRLDLKQNPLYESEDMALFKTHY